MAAFDKFKKAQPVEKASSPSRPVTPHRIKVNPYATSPQMALDLMARICSARPSERRNKWLDKIKGFVIQKTDKTESVFINFIDENRNKFLDPDFKANFSKALEKLVFALDSESISRNRKMTVVVAGGFNAGKSSLLNHLVECPKLLPEDIVPTTVVPAHLHCQSNKESLQVLGVNKADALVPLNEAVLNCISHSTPGGTAQQIATALKYFIVEIPHSEFENIVFIDTPGYDNAESSKMDNETDRKIAKQYLENGDVLLWLSSYSKGPIPADDWIMINKFTRGPIIIVLTKSDLESVENMNQIFEMTVQESCKHENIVDVVSLSLMKGYENRTMSLSGRLFNDVLNETAKSIHRKTAVEIAWDELSDLFMAEIKASEQAINDLKKTYQERKIEQNNTNKYYLSQKNSHVQIVKKLRKTLLKDIDASATISAKSAELNSTILTAFKKANDALEKYNNGRFWSNENVSEIISSSKYSIDSLDNQRISLNNNLNKCDSLKEREEWCKYIESELNKLLETIKENSNELSQECDNNLKRITDEKSFIAILKRHQKNLSNWKDKVLADLNSNGNLYSQGKSVTREIPNIFNAIASLDFEKLILSLSEEKDITTVYNNEGLSPLTYAAHCGNIEALRLFLKEASLDKHSKDKRGFNIYHSALTALKLETCQFISSIDPTLADDCTSYGETSIELSQKVMIEHMDSHKN